MKLRNKILSCVLVLCMLLNYVPASLHAASENLALGKEATASSSYPGRPWTPDKAVDGIIDDTTTKASRWSSKRATGTTNEDNTDRGTKEQWLTVDLGKESTIGQVNIFWEAAFAKKYKLQYSLDGVEFTDIKEYTSTSGGLKKHSDFDSVTARYLRVYCLEPNNANYGYSIFELEVYKDKPLNNASDVITRVEEISPSLSEDGTKIVLPEVPEGYEISLYGSDNKQVIDMNGNIIQPLVDMDVHVVYKVTKTTDPNDTAVSTKDATITIKGKETQTEQDNVKPNVIPGLREWKGSTGEFVLTNNSRIKYTDESLKEAADMIQSYFRDMLEINVEIEQGTPKKGDIYLLNGETVETIGEEGYLLDIDDYVTITAPTYMGLIYGGTSITQILYQSDTHMTAPKGLARDYPKYEIRAGMIDVGRVYVPIEYLQEMAVYMSWFKLNEIQVHINDYWGASGYSAFRVESKKYPLINAKDGFYTQEEYRQFQLNLKKHGIDVVTEIDTPYHSEAFRPYAATGEVVMNGAGSLDITTEENFNINAAFIEDLIDELVDGDNPVIQSDKFHIGTDEYNKAYGEQMRKWTDHFINYVNDKGKETRLWGSLGSRGFNGTTPVSNKATVNLWAAYWSEVQETFDAGFDIINTEGGWLYIVPGGNAGYPDRYDSKKIYDRFEVNNFASDRSGCGKIMPFAHPQTKGASFAVWNDMTSFRTGFSWFDIYDRFKEAVTMVSEKTWFGEDQPDQNYEQFRSRVDAVQNKVPNANPGRFVESKTDQIVDYNFVGQGEMLQDLTENYYDAKIHNGTFKNGKITFNNDGYLSLPMESVGYPYTVFMNVNMEEITEETTLFAGSDGAFYADINGKLGYRRGDYAYTFDYKLELNKDVNLALTCNKKDLSLYVNGKYIGNGKLTNATIGGKAQVSSTFVLPVERVFENSKGSLSGLTIYNREFTQQEIEDELGYVSRENLALNKPASASALEVNDGRFTADKAVDGIVSKESRVSFAKADEQWLLIDLEEEKTFSEVTINFESSVGKYEVQVSNDGKNFTTVYTKNEAAVIGATPKVEKISFEPVSARYVRYVQKERWTHTSNGQKYSGSIYEFEVYRSLKTELLDSIHTFEEVLANYSAGYSNGQLDVVYYESLVNLLAEYKVLADSNELTQEVLETAKTRLNKEEKEIEKHILFVKEDAEKAFDELYNVDYHNYTVASYEAMRSEMDVLRGLLDTLTNYKEVNEFIENVNEIRTDLVVVNNAKLVALIEYAEGLDANKYVDMEALETALEDSKVVYEHPISQEKIDQAVERLQSAIDALVRVYEVVVNGEVAARGIYNEKVTVTAPVVEGKEFTAWLYNGNVISTEEIYTFFLSKDMELTPCYEEVSVEVQAILANTILTKRADTKADIKFVAQLVVPDGYTVKDAGLVWSSKEDTELSLDNTNLKPTYITRISNTDQFSVTIKGMPAGRFIRGKIFATLVDGEGNESVVYSEETRVVNK